MTIASAIQTKQTQVASAYTAVSNKGGTLPQSQNLSNLANAISSITTGITPTGTIIITSNNTYDVTNYASAVVNVDTVNNTNLSISPLTTAQSFTVSAPYTGYYTVSVSAVTSSIDSNIKASNIKSGISILGVNGSVVELAGETRTVSITSTAGNTFTPSSGKNGITSIKVTPTNQAKTITPTTSSQSISVPSGYSGFGALTVNAVTSSIDANITAGNIKKDVTILGVTGTLAQSIIIKNYIQRTNGQIELLASGNYILNGEDSNITTFSMFYNAYSSDTTITSVHLGGLTTISGSNVFAHAFLYDTGITSVDLSSLTTVSGAEAFSSIFKYCTGITSVDLSSLTIVTGNNAFLSAFRRTSLQTLSFPALTSRSFGSKKNQFEYMLTNVTGCTVHFPSNLQSVIGSWSDVTAGFGGTNTTVLFDLPATT